MLVDDLQDGPASRKINSGYAVNIDASLMADDLKTYCVEPVRPARVMAGDSPTINMPMTENGKPDMGRLSEMRPTFATVFLLFPDRATAKASSIGKYLK